jgi:hypothetical protein
MLRERLATHPDDVALAAQLATALDRLAWARSELKDYAGELAARSENLVNLRGLLARAPSNAALQAALLDEIDRVVDLIVASHGDLPGSEAAAREAAASARILAAAEPHDAKRDADIALRLKQLSDPRGTSQ